MYVGCIELFFKKYIMQFADSSIDHLFCFISLWPWPLAYEPDNEKDKWTKYSLCTSQVLLKFFE